MSTSRIASWVAPLAAATLLDACAMSAGPPKELDSLRARTPRLAGADIDSTVR
jgi:hypothetical protein